MGKVILINIILALSVGAWAVQYDISYWMPFLVHHAVTVLWLAAAVVALVLGGPAICLAILTWAIRLAS